MANLEKYRACRHHILSYAILVLLLSYNPIIKIYFIFVIFVFIKSQKIKKKLINILIFILKKMKYRDNKNVNCVFIFTKIQY